MTRKIPKLVLPPWFGEFSPEQFLTWRNNLTRVLKSGTDAIVEQVNSQVQGVGDELTVTGTNQTLKVASAIHLVGGTGSIKYIQPPTLLPGASSNTAAVDVTGFTGPIFLVPTAAFTTVNTGTTPGKIAINTTAVVGRCLMMVYDGETFYPSYT